MKYQELLSAASENTSHHKKAFLFSIILHLVVFLFFILMSSVERVSGYDTLFVSLHSEAALSLGSKGSDVRTKASLPVKKLHKKPPVAALPVFVSRQNQRAIPEEGKGVTIAEKALSRNIPQEIRNDISSHPTAPAMESFPSKAFAAPETESLLSGASLAGIADGRTTGASVVLPAQSRFGDYGAPTFVYQAVPVYPSLARRLGKEGRVLLKLLIDANGKLLNIEVVEAAGYGFTEAAVDAVKKSTYAPGIRDGVRVETWAILPVSFRFM